MALIREKRRHVPRDMAASLSADVSEVNVEARPEMVQEEVDGVKLSCPSLLVLTFSRKTVCVSASPGWCVQDFVAAHCGKTLLIVARLEFWTAARSDSPRFSAGSPPEGNTYSVGQAL